jgi:5'(3')-deoxyribonucleotidase
MRIDFKKPRVVVDLDDTSFDFINPYISFNNLKYGTNLKKEDFTSYRFNEFRGGTMEESVASVKEFCYSPFFKNVKPFPDAVEVLQKVKEEIELFVGTSRSFDMQELTFNQISLYFPNVFSDVFFSSNHYTGAKNSGKTKAEICKKLNALYLIDDSLIYSIECINKGIGAILFDSPWNKNGNVEEIIRVNDWKEIGGILLR